MNTNGCRLESENLLRTVRRRVRRLRQLAARAVCAVLFVVPALAGAEPVDPAPDGNAFVTNYDYDNAFALAGQYIDHFAGNNSNDYRGQKITRLSNGDVVVAGIVPRPGFTTPNQLGLVRYSPSGQRRVWSSVGAAYTHFSGQYIIYPNGNSGQPTGALLEVVDMATHGSSIYVMLNEQTGVGASRPLMAVFSLNGSFRGWWFNTPTGGGNLPGRAFVIQPVNANEASLVQVGDDLRATGTNNHRIWMTRSTINADGSLSADAGFGTAGVAFAQLRGCTYVGSPANCGTYAAGIASIGSPFATGASRFYVAVTVRRFTEGTSLDSDAEVMRFNTNGSIDSSFDAYSNLSDGGNRDDYAVAVQTGFRIVLPLRYADEVYLVANVARTTQRGIGVAKFDENGALVPAFGAGGKVVFGGCGSGAGNCNFSNVQDVPWAMVRDGNTLAIAGWHRGFEGATDPTVRFNYPLFAAVNTGNGSVSNFDSYYSGLGDATFYDVVANGDGGYTFGGDIRALSTGETQSFVTARLQPLDVIFRNGVD